MEIGYHAGPNLHTCAKCKNSHATPELNLSPQAMGFTKEHLPPEIGL